jgi:DNA-binding response OmpR family regulator
VAHPSRDETLTILVVEDDDAVAELIRAVLNDVTGWGATVVHDASAAREVFRHVRMEVLVVDVSLPGISGIELLEMLRTDPHWDEPPVLLMSARPEQADISAALREGLVTAFLAEPFEVEQLVAAVRTAVAARSDGAGMASAGDTGPLAAHQVHRREARRVGAPILVVEEDPKLLALFKRMLEGEGYPVAAAANRREALRAVRAERPSLVVLDLDPPRPDRHTIASDLRTTCGPGLPIVVVTATDNGAEVADDIGPCAYLHKPFSVSSFLALVSRCIDGLAADGRRSLGSRARAPSGSARRASARAAARPSG